MIVPIVPYWCGLGLMGAEVQCDWGLSSCLSQYVRYVTEGNGKIIIPTYVHFQCRRNYICLVFIFHIFFPFREVQALAIQALKDRKVSLVLQGFQVQLGPQDLLEPSWGTLMALLLSNQEPWAHQDFLEKMVNLERMESL